MNIYVFLSNLDILGNVNRIREMRVSEQLRGKLKKLASRECWCDDTEVIVNDCAGGNIDDAYSGGFEDGQAKLAEELLNDLLNQRTNDRV